MNRKLIALAITTAIALPLAGCGGGDDSPAVKPQPAPTPAPVPPAPAPTTGHDAMHDAGNFSYYNSRDAQQQLALSGTELSASDYGTQIGHFPLNHDSSQHDDNVRWSPEDDKGKGADTYFSEDLTHHKAYNGKYRELISSNWGKLLPNGQYEQPGFVGLLVNQPHNDGQVSQYAPFYGLTPGNHYTTNDEMNNLGAHQASYHGDGTAFRVEKKNIDTRGIDNPWKDTERKNNASAETGDVDLSANFTTRKISGDFTWHTPSPNATQHFQADIQQVGGGMGFTNNQDGTTNNPWVRGNFIGKDAGGVVGIFEDNTYVGGFHAQGGVQPAPAPKP